MVSIGARLSASAITLAVLAVAFSISGCTALGSGVATEDTGSVRSTATAAAEPATAPAPAPPSLPPTPAFTQQFVALAPGVSDEASGIAASTSSPGAYYLVDDATGADEITAVGTDGGVLADISIEGMSAGNAEALSAGPCGATPLAGRAPASSCLYVGDIGDNKARRSDIRVYRIAEPDLAAPSTNPVPADQWRYSYPDGAQNAEAMMVAPDGSVIVVTKPGNGDAPTRMYRGEPGGGELMFLREFTPPEPQVRLKTLFTGNVVTDLTAAPGRVLLLTYDELTEYTAPDPAADITGFPDWPHQRLPMTSLPQAEGVAAMVSGCGYVIASEAGPGGSSGSLEVVSCT